MKIINSIIKSIDTESPRVNPTEIYNEGWITRFFVYYSILEKIKIGYIDFDKIVNWCSEGLISSPFLKRTNGDTLAEGYTHADMALGDFSVNFSKRGELSINDDSSVFGIIEAKMGSNLSKGTKNAPLYNQASRNVACIAHNTSMHKNCSTFFAVVAPEKTITKYDLKSQVDKNKILNQIEQRFKDYPKEFQDKNMELILTKSYETKTMTFSYEEWLSKFSDKAIIKELSCFYDKAKKWNKID